MEALPLMVLLGLGVLGTGVAQLRRRLRLRRMLAAAPVTDLAALDEGQRARVVGVVAPADEVLVAPLTGRDCVLYRLEVQEFNAFSDAGWTTLATEQRGVEFELHASDGAYARIIPVAARVLLRCSDLGRSGPGHPPSQRQERLLARLQLSPRRRWLRRTLRFREAIIAPHARIEVLGEGIREPDPRPHHDERMYRDSLPTRLRLTSSAQHPLLLWDGAQTNGQAIYALEIPREAHAPTAEPPAALP